MLGRSNAPIKLIISLFVGIWLSGLLLVGSRSSQAATPETILSLAPGYTVELVPDQMTFTGDVTTQGNCAPPMCSWLEDTPTGAIILGVDPTSPDPNTWDGGSATAEVYLEDRYSPTVLVLKLSWPDRDGRGLRSPEQDRVGIITFDGRPLWGKRTTRLSPLNNYYYAAEYEPILMTLVVTQSITHSLSFSVSPHTAWDLSRIELSAYPYPATIRGIGYSPYRDCQYPGGDLQPSIQDMEEDLFRLFHTTNAIRTYSARGVNGQIPALANAIGLPVFAGAWIDADPGDDNAVQEDDAEIEALIELANTTELAGVIVGNEYYLRHRSTEAIYYLRDRIRQVKNSIPEDVPVTTAEIDNLMFDWEGLDDFEPVFNEYSNIILNEIDFVMVHIYPFWNGMSIDGAAAFTVNRYQAIQGLVEQTYPGQDKWVIIGEAGWPSAGAPKHREEPYDGTVLPTDSEPAVPSLANQRHYMLEFLYLAEQEGVEYMYFDAFDELWKIGEPGRVGQNWGYGYFDRTAKHDVYGVLLPAEQLPSSEPDPFYRIYLPYIMGGPGRTFPVYTEWPMGPGYFVPSGWMADDIEHIDEYIDLYECDRADPHRGEMAVRASFSPTGTNSWGGVYWQYPENNWGDDPDGGLDLSWANKLTFWAKGETGGERIRFFVGGIGAIDNLYPDSLRPALSTGFIQLEDIWQKYTINLRGQDLTRVVGGFGWATDQCANPGGATFYLDDIIFEYDPEMVPPPPSPPPSGSVFPVYTDAAAQDNHYFPTGWMGDGTVPGRVSLTECWYDNPHSGQTSIRIAYTEEVIGWAGIYWVHPAENWGDRPGGVNLTGADRLSFWARSDTPNAQIRFLIGGIGYPGGTACSNPSQEPYPDSVCPKIEQVETLSSTWTRYTIDLPQSRDLSEVVGGFGWVTQDEAIFYLDDIIYEFD
jgi:exo-beta-1,3-glucanase (GH17 family)